MQDTKIYFIIQSPCKNIFFSLCKRLNFWGFLYSHIICPKVWFGWYSLISFFLFSHCDHRQVSYFCKAKAKTTLHKIICFNKIPGHCAKTSADVGTVETGVSLSQQLDYHTAWPTNIKWILARFSELLDSFFPQLWMILRVFFGLQITKNMDTRISFFPNQNIFFFYKQMKPTYQNNKKIPSGFNVKSFTKLLKV